MTRPIARVTTDRVGYIATGIGLAIGVAAFSPEKITQTVSEKRDQIRGGRMDLGTYHCRRYLLRFSIWGRNNEQQHFRWLRERYSALYTHNSLPVKIGPDRFTQTLWARLVWFDSISPKLLGKAFLNKDALCTLYPYLYESTTTQPSFLLLTKLFNYHFLSKYYLVLNGLIRLD